MKNFVNFCKKFLHIKKPEPWYKRCLKKTAFILDMKRRNKFITFFALLFISVYFCLPSMETIIKKVVHKYGSEITGTDVVLGGLDLKLSKGEAHIKSIKVNNPKGYKSPYLFSLKDIGVVINISSLTDDTIIIDSIVIDKPIVTFEMLSLNQNNIGDVLNNVKTNTAQTLNKEKNHPVSTEKPTEKPKKIIIKSLSVREGKIKVFAGLKSHKKQVDLMLPDIVMHNIGQEKNGVSVAETISTITTKVLQTASQAVLSSNLKDVTAASYKEVQQASRQIRDNSRKTLSKVKANGSALTQDTAKQLKNGLNKILD